MDDIMRIDLVDIELTGGSLHRSWLNRSIGSGDAKANAFGVRVYRNAEPVNLTGGSVQGYFRNSQGENIAITSGNTVDGNAAYVVLPQACYNYDGQFTLAIKVINSSAGVTGTMRIVDGMVDNTNSGGAVAPTETVPTYQEVLAIYDEMVETVADYEEVVAGQDEKIDDLSEAAMLPRTSESTDLNDFQEVGFYILDSTIEYTNAPFDLVGASMLLVYHQVNSTFIVQMYVAMSQGKVYIRRYSGSPRAWTAWVVDNPPLFKYLNTDEDITDINDLSGDGWFICAYATEYDNDPIGANNDRFILSFSTQSSSAYRIQMAIAPTKGIVYSRIKKGNPATWRRWINITGTDKRTIPYSFTGTAQASQGQNVGMNLRVMSYNICNFNFDSAVYISDEKLLNLRKMFYEAKADILLIQEDRPHIDASDTKPSNNYVYYPIYPNVVGGDGPSIHSKMTTGSDYGTLTYSNGRTLRYALYTTGDIKLLLVSTHPVYSYNGTGGTSAESIAARSIQYDELFKWVNGEITLHPYGSSTPIQVPEHTHCIIGIDANSVTDDDKSNILSYATDADFIAGNGGAIGWFQTEMKIGYSIDNVFVSNNIIINSIEAYNDWFSDLYSDHVPVVADLTLI